MPQPSSCRLVRRNEQVAESFNGAVMSKRKQRAAQRTGRARRVSEVLADARAALRRVDRGIDGLRSADEQRQLDGLQDVVVYGRVVISTINNLRRAPGFADWWGLAESRLLADPVYAYFKDMRDDLEHEGVFKVWTAPGVITTLQPTAEQWAHLAPPGTEQTALRLDGFIEFRGEYGVHVEALPSHLMTRTLKLLHPPPGHENEAAAETASAYHALLRQTLLDARGWFGHMP